MLYETINKHSNLTLEEIGILALLLENGVEDDGFEFNTRESFLKYFKISSHYLCEKIFNGLIEKEIVSRKEKKDKHVYILRRTKVKIIVPISYSENKVLKLYIENELDKFDSYSRICVKKVLDGYKEYMNRKNIVFNLGNAEKFFEIWEGCSKQIIKIFMEIWLSRKLYGGYGEKYFKVMLDGIKGDVQSKLEKLKG